MALDLLVVVLTVGAGPVDAVPATGEVDHRSNNLLAVVQAMLRLTKLRLRDEVNDAMRYFELSLLSQGPMLNAAVNAAFGQRPERERQMLRIGSWIGGDRDGLGRPV